MKEGTEKKLVELGLGDKVEFRVSYLDKANEKELADAALYDVPFDSVPTMVVVPR